MAIGYLDSQYLTDIASAIRTKKGTYNSMTVSQMPQEIASIQGNDPIAVRFLDFDGTVVDELTDAELTALTQLPSAPNHSQDEIPLTFDEWNWLLADIKTFRTANPTWTVNVGANYHTTDGKTHFIYEVEYDGWETRIQSNSASATLDWGDGTVVSISSNSYATHTYNKGRYHAVFNQQGSGEITFNYQAKTNFLTEVRFSTNTQAACIPTGFDAQYSQAGYFKSVSYPSNHTTCYVSSPSLSQSFGLYTWVSVPRAASDVSILGQNLKYQPLLADVRRALHFTYCFSLEEVFCLSNWTTISSCRDCHSLKRVHLSANMTNVPSYSFANCYALEEINTDNVTILGDYAFQACYSLKKVNLSNATTLGSSCFSNAYALEEITLSDNLTKIPNYCFYCSPYGMLHKLTIPASVTSIGNNAFYNQPWCVVTCKSTSPATLGTNSFGTSGSGPQAIIVPYSADHSVLASYQSAWSAYASIIKEAEPS